MKIPVYILMDKKANSINKVSFDRGELQDFINSLIATKDYYEILTKYIELSDIA